MKPSTILLILVSAAQFVNAARAQNLIASKEPVSGTLPRTELESKLAVWVAEDFDPAQLTTALAEGVHTLLRSHPFQFSQLVRRDFVLNHDFQPFLFKDYYIDNPNFDIARSGSAYRLRYRWSNATKYLAYQWLPFLSFFYPSRCEIQFKTDYHPVEDFTLEAEETRFEFRKESRPFSEDPSLAVPPAPWPKKTFLEHAYTGRYGGYRMAPTERLLKKIPQLDLPTLSPALVTETTRHRIHLDIQNPWGQGPNPDQVVILTLDVAKISPQRELSTLPERLVELEIEIDRSTLAGLFETLQLEATPWNSDPLIQIAILQSKRAELALRADLLTLRHALTATFEKTLGLQPLPVNFKYARILNRIGILQKGLS